MRLAANHDSSRIPNTLTRFLKHIAFALVFCVLSFGTAWAEVALQGGTEDNPAALTDSTVDTLSGGYYAVNSNITFDHTLTLAGDVTLSLSAGKTMTVNTSSNYGINGKNGNVSYSLTVCGDGALTVTANGGAIYDVSQYNQTGGTINLTGGNSGIYVSYGTVNISGGTITAKGSTSMGINADNGINISGGTVNASGKTYGLQSGIGSTISITGGVVSAEATNTDDICAGTVSITGGQVTAKTKGIVATRTHLTLGYSNATDFIDFILDSHSVCEVIDGQILTDGTNDYSGLITVDLLTALRGGKKLEPKIYTVSVSANISADREWAQPNNTVTLSYTGSIPAGYEAVFKVNGTAIEGNTFPMPSEAVTVTAELTPINYTISYDLAGGSVGTANPESYTVETAAFTLTNPTRTGYDFAGWTGTGLTGAMQSVEIAQGSTGNRSYTATWTPISYELSYTLNGGTATNPTTYTIESADFTLNNPARNAYTFTGWTGSNGTTPQTSVTITKGNTGAKTYTAHWRAIAYTISYDLGGGTLPEGYKVSYDVESDTFKLPKPEREGYEFGGWTLSGDNEPASTDLEVPQGSTENREYVAHWDAIRYTLSYDLAGGTATNPATYTIESEDFTLNRPTMAGQKFTGWIGSADVASSRDVTITHGSTGNRTYTATWGDYSNKYYVHTPDGLSITQSGWNSTAGVITASADAEDFDPAKKVVVSVTSPNDWKLKDTSFWGWLNSDTVSYTIKNAQTDTTPTTSWTFTSADLFKDGGTTVTFGAEVEDFSAKRPGAYEDNVKFSVNISE